MTGIAILTVGTAAAFVAVKAGLSPHEHFKRTAAAVRKVHCAHAPSLGSEGCCLVAASILSNGGVKKQEATVCAAKNGLPIVTTAQILSNEIVKTSKKNFPY